MPLVVPDEGEIQLLQKMLKVALSTDESYVLKLYKVDYTPISTTSKASFTEASFTNYAARTLTHNWSAAVENASSAAQVSYGTTPQSWTCGATGNTIYGYWVEGATSAKVLWAERFSTSRVLANGDVLNITPQFTLQSQN